MNLLSPTNPDFKPKEEDFIRFLDEIVKVRITGADIFSLPVDGSEVYYVRIELTYGNDSLIACWSHSGHSSDITIEHGNMKNKKIRVKTQGEEGHEFFPLMQVHEALNHITLNVRPAKRKGRR